MTRVVAMFSARRSSVATSSTVGKAEKSSGRSIHRATIRISTESAIEKASPMSMRKAGIGRKKIDRIATMPMAKPTSRPPRAGVGRAAAPWPGLVGVALAEVVVAMLMGSCRPPAPRGTGSCRGCRLAEGACAEVGRRRTPAPPAQRGGDRGRRAGTKAAGPGCLGSWIPARGPSRRRPAPAGSEPGRKQSRPGCGPRGRDRTTASLAPQALRRCSGPGGRRDRPARCTDGAVNPRAAPTPAARQGSRPSGGSSASRIARPRRVPLLQEGATDRRRWTQPAETSHGHSRFGHRQPSRR